MNNRPNLAGARPAQSSSQSPGQASAPAEAEILPPAGKNTVQPFGTEALLDSLIEECRRLVREVATPSMAAMTDPLERRLFMQSAVSFIEAGAKVGDTIARLHSGGVQGETRHRVLVEYVPPALAPLRADDRTLLEEDEEWG